LRKVLTVGHEVKEADINEGIEDTFGRFQQGDGLPAQVTGFPFTSGAAKVL